MAADAQLVNPDRQFFHRPIMGPGLLKAGTLVDAEDVVDQVVMLAGARQRVRVYFKTDTGIDGVLAFKVIKPGGLVAGMYDTALITPVAITGGTEEVIDLTTEYFGEALVLLEFTGDNGIAAPGAILTADICGV